MTFRDNPAFPHSSPRLDARRLETNLFSTDEQVNEQVGEQTIFV